MAVRFLPPPEDRAAGGGPDRGDLAEVIELRGLLAQRSWRPRTSPADDDSAAEPDTTNRGAAPEAEVAAEAEHVSGARIGTELEGEPLATDGNTAPATEPEAPQTSHVAPVRSLRSAHTVPLRKDAASFHRSARDAELAQASLEEATASDLSRSAEEAVRTASEDGVRLMARKARSSGELRAELMRLDHDAVTVDTVIDEFERNHYLDDLGLARAQTEKLRESKRASRSQIRLKLRDRRLPDDVIESALAELDDDDEYALLRDAATDRARRLSGLDRQTAERRLLGFLARRGWSGEPAMRAARDALNGDSQGSGSGVRFR